MTAAAAKFDVQAELRCELDDRPLSIRASDGIVIVEVPDVATGLKLFQLGSSRGSYVTSIRSLQALLNALMLRLEVQIRGRSFVRLGWQTGNSLWRLVGLPPMHVRLSSLLRTRGASLLQS